MRILLTNDDGIHAPGILALKQWMEKSMDPPCEIFVVAPERPRSASGHSITLHKPLRLTETRLLDGTTGWAASGTPTDCVTLGWDVVMDGRVDLVVSGINAGPNLGWDVTYSGTVAAAIEGVILGAPAVAVSVASESDGIDFESAARFTSKLAGQIGRHGLDAWTLLNVNVPASPEAGIRGAMVTRQGRRQYVDRIDRRIDPSGKPYYWLRGSLKEELHDEDSDVHAVLNDFISVTPIHLDQTAEAMFSRLHAWDLTL
jgi:5'-nucleotidase